MADWIIYTTIFAVTLLSLIKIAVSQMAKRRKPSEILEDILFPQGNIQKRFVIDSFKKVTNQNFLDKEILDFFMKEKGLQMIYINSEIASNVKKYVKKPTLIDLNYFERVKFHEVFFNYPLNFKKQMIETSETVFEGLPIKKTQEKISLIA